MHRGDRGTRRRSGFSMGRCVLALAVGMGTAWGQESLLVEDFEFCTSDEAAAAGVIDKTDPPNQPTFYIFGDDENASPQEGFFSIGTDAVFCINWQVDCTSGSKIGFRRYVSEDRFPQTCPDGTHYAPLQSTYGDPAVPGPKPPDFTLAELTTVWDAYGDGAFADGLTGTHLWLRFVDCEGEMYEFINYSEESLYSELWTLDVMMGENIVRIAPESLTDVPAGDRLLTEIAAIEVYIQDSDNPPTTVGKWYVDNLRAIEPGPPLLPGDYDLDGDVDLFDFAAFDGCRTGPGGVVPPECQIFDADLDSDIDWHDFGGFQTYFGEGSGS